MGTLKIGQWAMALVVVWLAVLLILLLLWFEFGPGVRWWVAALYAVVIAVADFFTIRMSPFRPVGAKARRGP